jgi:hypothetical protein
MPVFITELTDRGIPVVFRGRFILDATDRGSLRSISPLITALIGFR